MCSLWMSMEESDDGNLEAVVRRYSRMNPYKWHPGAAGIDPGATFNGANSNSISISNSNSMVFPNLMLTTAPRPPAAMDLQDLCSPFYRNGSNGGLLRSVSVSSCSSLMFDSMEVEATGAGCPSIFGTESPARTASMKMSGDHRESEEEFGQGKSCGTELSPRAPEPRDVVGSTPIKAEPAKECDGSSSSLSQAVENGGSSQPAASKGQGSKRRKTQQKRIVCVPAAAGGSNRPSGEGLPSDLWAWRKYGQKPIKGSPYPRGYYRCSSSKGCSARKQVERSRTDPSMLVITYTSDHNHPWPTHRNALAGSTRQTATATSSEKTTPAESRTGGPKDEISETIMMSENNPVGENNDNNNNNNGTALSEAGAGSNSSPERAPADPENLSTIIQEDHDPVAAELGNIFRSDDDFFAELGELPDSLNIFPPRPFDDDKSDDDEAGSSVVDPFNLFNWSSPTTFVDTKTSM